MLIINNFKNKKQKIRVLWETFCLLAFQMFFFNRLEPCISLKEHTEIVQSTKIQILWAHRDKYLDIKAARRNTTGDDKQQGVTTGGCSQ